MSPKLYKTFALGAEVAPGVVIPTIGMYLPLRFGIDISNRATKVTK